jgi:hypothetical protein
MFRFFRRSADRVAALTQLDLQRVRAYMHGVPGGFLAFYVLILVFVADVWLSSKYPHATCCKIHNHLTELIDGAGVAVAFVLTYLAALIALPSPGRQLLSSALGYLAREDPELAAIDEDVPLTKENFEFFREFANNARDRAMMIGTYNRDELASVEKACDLFVSIVNLARPPHRRANPTEDDLEKMGYCHPRAHFLARIVFRRDAEKRWLLRASVLCAIVFAYAVVMKWLSQYHWLEVSFALVLLGYLIIFSIAVGFSIALALRMWPHTVERSLIAAALGPLEEELKGRAARLVGGMSSFVDEVKKGR